MILFEKDTSGALCSELCYVKKINMNLSTVKPLI